jgi:hypothetical protein
MVGKHRLQVLEQAHDRRHAGCHGRYMSVGTVTAMNPKSGKFAVEIQESSFAVFELKGPVAVQVGSKVSGNLTERGLQSLQLSAGQAVVPSFQRNRLVRHRLGQQDSWR